MSFRLLFLGLLVSARVWAYVDITPIEIGENPGVSGSLALSLSNQQGNTEKLDAGVDGNLRYDSNTSYALWLLGGYNYTDVPGEEIENKGFVHGRYLQRFLPALYGELFFQSETNKLKEIENRTAAGAGVRFRFYDDAFYGRAYLGTGLLHEWLRFSNPKIDPDESNMRFFGYLLYSKVFENDTTINAYLVYQPKISEVSDYTLHSILEFQTPLLKNFFLLLRLVSNYDSTPPLNNHVKTYDVSQKVALMWKF